MTVMRSLILIALCALAGFVIAGCQAKDPPLGPTNPQAAQQTSSQPAFSRPGKGGVLGGKTGGGPGGGTNPGGMPAAH
jgi:hypothetical protein